MFDISIELSTKKNKKAPIRVLFFFKAFSCFSLESLPPRPFFEQREKKNPVPFY